MSNDSAVRPILPQDASSTQSAHMGSFPFIPHQYPQRETQKNYVFVDEHNRHKRLKVMRACEGCRRRKIKCDAATTNTWPCSACIRLKLHCVRPNGYDGSSDSAATHPPATYETILNPSGQFQQIALQPHVPKHAADVYPSHGAYPDPDASAYQSMPFDSQHSLHYTTVPPPPVSLLDHHHHQPYAPPHAFPTPPLQPAPRPDDSSEACSTDSYQQQDLADLLGTLKVNELGTAPYLRNKASFRHHEMPAVEDDDDFESVLPPIITGPGHKVRVPPELMPDDASALHYFDLYFAQVHPYVPVLDKVQFYRQWNSARETISPLVLEALFAIGGRLAEDPAQGHQWLALASRHADSFMDIPRLSTLQALLMILKAREAAPKRGYYYRSWMTVVQCVQMAKDLGLDEHYEDHQVGRPCDSSPAECQLRTRIWQTIFVCEVMVGTPQGRHDLSVDLESVDFSIPLQVEGGDDGEYLVSRNFTYFARLVRNIGRMSKVYAKIGRKREWGMDPEFQQLSQSISSFLSELPADMAITFPPGSSPPWIPSSFLGNLHSYYYLTLILYHRPVLSFLDPAANESQWKHHMSICYDAAKSLCRLQESIVQTFSLTGLQAMQRGFSFTVYAGLSCIVLHLVAIVSPDPELNSDAPEYFTRHMRIMEKVMEAWPMPELQKQIDAVREAFSADVRRPFVLKPSFPYGSPHSSSHPSPPGGTHRYRQAMDRTGPLDQHLGTPHTQPVSYPSHPISPPVSAGPGDSKGDSPPAQSLVLMPQDGQAPDMRQDMAIPNSQPTWNPARIFEQWNTSFGSPAQAEPVAAAQADALDMATSSGPSEISTIPAVQGVGATLAADGAQQMPAQAYSAPTPMANFITPAMWQESVASVYEGGLKRSWDYDTMQTMKRR
ncbi:fungal specific transcription factor [Hirsutella rhossiliensis]|uniref:Fungal specific transcription factor domain-containing protein n=1 Tax=Hirsutella rhossiliensis TaxID=111463 RepID=A0A9P8NAB1_9HYPO|nr:fungal specific transcription factor domain-containing protein [Hirsutella rhossiliensis]KAH0968609.1 fungal specific transcription factor domain-containing protein [Hirsutella rhossiliensis]